MMWLTYSSTRFNNIITEIFGAYCLYIGWRTVSKFSRSDIYLLLPGVLFLVYLVGLFWTTDLLKGFKEVETRIPLAAFPFMFYLLRFKLTKEDIINILYFFV